MSGQLMMLTHHLLRGKTDDLLKTTEEVEEKTREFGLEEKLRYYEENPGSAEMKDNLGHMLNSHVSRLFDTEEYALLNKMPSTPIHMEKEQLQKTVNAIGSNYLNRLPSCKNTGSCVLAFAVFTMKKVKISVPMDRVLEFNQIQ